MKYVAIFEGGGAKGLAHVGALKATEERGISFEEVGGTSAGAIMAAFVAAGFRADELFCPGSPDSGLFSVNFLQFLEGDDWNRFQEFQNALNNLGHGKLRLAKLFYCFAKYWRLFSVIWREKGIFKIDSFQDWLDNKLKEKLNLDNSVTFSNLGNLTIISTDLNGCQMFLFNKRTTPNIKVAEAVAASIAIPLFFKPKNFQLDTPDAFGNGKNNSLELVDGGLVSNYPTWIFDEDRINNEGSLVTIGYKLVNRLSGESKSVNFLDHLTGLINAALWGDQSLEIRGIEHLHSIPLRVSTGTLEFDLDVNKKINLYNEGKECASLYFSENIGILQKKDVSKVLEIASVAAKEYLSKSNTNGTSFTHLRANIFAPTFHDSERLRLVYSYNMESDADDNLLIKVGSGAAGVCFQQNRVVLCNLQKAKTTFETEWRLSKYQQALIRSSLKSLISLPIFHNNTKQVIAVLSFDSDDDILDAMQKAEPQLMELTSLVHKALY